VATAAAPRTYGFKTPASTAGEAAALIAPLPNKFFIPAP
jgi:hypothetical protein